MCAVWRPPRLHHRRRDRGTALFDHERIKAGYIGRAAYLVLVDLDRGEVALDTPRGAQLLLGPA